MGSLVFIDLKYLFYLKVVTLLRVHLIEGQVLFGGPVPQTDLMGHMTCHNNGPALLSPKTHSNKEGKKLIHLLSQIWQKDSMLVYMAWNFTMINTRDLKGETENTSVWTHSSLWLLLKNIDNRKQFP